ncbi:hypothetical protein [Amycolatopsis alkalitolerans]|uniref:Uncharacterized protein n=1 Tax=Amycolatopsis alkalitolerans TaxID=2547244 RepID=A0A5C4LV69_9PSEU|nr:hypothetical protein [Amycolatopsis alkalitolerans]TNC21903.1 hypothetical protein FG385_26840 [Amycolatopsis alkalitolerans]
MSGDEQPERRVALGRVVLDAVGRQYQAPADPAAQQMLPLLGDDIEPGEELALRIRGTDRQAGRHPRVVLARLQQRLQPRPVIGYQLVDLLDPGHREHRSRLLSSPWGSKRLTARKNSAR